MAHATAPCVQLREASSPRCRPMKLMSSGRPRHQCVAEARRRARVGSGLTGASRQRHHRELSKAPAWQSHSLHGTYPAQKFTHLCDATASSSFEEKGYTILWVTKHTLKNDLYKNMYVQVCHLANQMLSKSDLEKKAKQPVKNLPSNWLPPMSYTQFTNMLKGKNKLYKKLIEKNGEKDPLKKTLIIFDEAHKIYDGSAAIDHYKLETAVVHSHNESGKDSVRILLMTGTPFTNRAISFIKTLNLILKPSQRMMVFDESELDKATKGNIIHIDMTQNGRYFAIPQYERVVTNPKEYFGLASELSALIERMPIAKKQASLVHTIKTLMKKYGNDEQKLFKKMETYVKSPSHNNTHHALMRTCKNDPIISANFLCNHSIRNSLARITREKFREIFWSNVGRPWPDVPAHPSASWTKAWRLADGRPLNQS
eukprot:364977-Chlamydomonas_euryale.AAC.1